MLVLDRRHDGQRGRLRAAEDSTSLPDKSRLPMRSAFGIRRPRRPVLGQELAGDVESVGQDVTSLRKGDRVFAATGTGLGAYAEYICLCEKPRTGAITAMPANLGYEEAAALPYGGGEALGFLRKAKVRSGQRVLVNGAGGSFGTFAVQLAKDLGAHVTAVDGVSKLEMLGRSAPIASSTTPRKTSRRAPTPTTSSSTWCVAHRPTAW